MPELPEVETIVRALRPEIVGRRIDLLELFHPRVYRRSSVAQLTNAANGSIITELRRRGKFIILDFDNNKPSLVIHLRMTGQLLISHEPLESKHIRSRFIFDDGIFLNFVDIRTFGLFFLIDGSEPDGFKKLGVEPLTEDFTAPLMYEMLQKTSMPIKNALLRQDFVAGIGNIYASEICFLSKLDPRKKSNRISKHRSNIIHSNTIKVLNAAVDGMGTTLSDFRRPDGTSGEFKNKLLVYGRKDLPCPDCNNNIERIVQNGRSTFFCPRCQH